MTMKRTPLLIALMSSGCLESTWDQLQEHFPDTATTAASATSTTDIPTTSAGADAAPVATVTGAAEETTSSSTDPGPGFTTGGPAENLPPTIHKFEVTDSMGSPLDIMSEAGQSLLQLEASDDVVSVRLYLDEVFFKELTPAEFPHAWDALSAKDNGPKRVFKVVVEDPEGLTAEATTELTIQLPMSGAEKCLFEDSEKGSVTSIITAIKYTPKAIFAVGVRDTGAGPKIAVWQLNADDCGIVPGWPKTPENWTTEPDLAALMSGGTALDLDADGNLVVGGNLVVNGKLQGYVVLLTPFGSRLWEKTAAVGDQVTSVAAARAQYSNRVFVGGSRQTSDNPVRTDAAIWVYQATGDSVYVAPPVVLAAPFTPDEFDGDINNERSEWVRAIVIQPGTGNALAVGEREFLPHVNELYARAFTAQVHPLGTLVGTPWTSWAPSYRHDAIRAVALCGDDLLAAGWTRDHAEPNAKPLPLMFWVESDGTSVKHRDEPQLSATETYGIACDREGKILSAATRAPAPRDAHVFAVPGQDGPRASYETGAPGDDGAAAIACDWRGFCGRGGYRTANGKPYAVVRVHHP